MSLESVNVYVLDDTNLHSPVANVVVRLFDSADAAFITQAITDVNGRAAFTLAVPAVYCARFFKDKVSIRQPQRIVTATPGPGILNDFDVYAHVYAPPEAVDPRLCCCSGYFKRPDNSPAVGHDLDIIPQFDPLLVDGNAMLTERLHARTDQDGYAQVNLVRFGQYQVTVEGLEDQQRVITVPDAPSVNLPDLLFPVVERIEFDPPGPWTLVVGDLNDFVVKVKVYTSDGRVLPGSAIQDVRWATADSTCAIVLPTSENITLRGLAAGTTELVPSRWDTSIVRIPNTPIQGAPVSIDVV